MQATRIGKDLAVRMTEEEAADLVIFLGVESRRRHEELTMQCWKCVNACDALLNELKGQGLDDDITPHCY